MSKVYDRMNRCLQSTYFYPFALFYVINEACFQFACWSQMFIKSGHMTVYLLLSKMCQQSIFFRIHIITFPFFSMDIDIFSYSHIYVSSSLDFPSFL